MYRTGTWSYNKIIRAANNFPADAGQIVQSNLFFLGHIPFVAGQTSIIIIIIKIIIIIFNL